MLLTGSCSSEPLDSGSLPGASGDMLLSVHSLSTGETATRAATGTAGLAAGGASTRLAGGLAGLDQSTSVGFYVQAFSESGKDYYKAQNNVQGRYDADGSKSWKPVKESPIWLNNQTAQLAVYAPYSSEQDAISVIPTVPTALTVPTAPTAPTAPTVLTATTASDGTADGLLSLTAALRSADGANDLCAGRFSANSHSVVSPGITAILEHLYARVVFTFIKYAGYTETATITRIEWNGTDVYKSATYNLFGLGTDIANAATTGISGSAYTIDKTNGNRNLDFKFEPGLLIGTDKTAADAARADLLLIPTYADFEADGTLTVTVSTTTTVSTTSTLEGVPTQETKTLSVTVPKGLFAGGRQLAAGKRFNITVRLSVADIIIESDDVQQTEWEDTDVNDIESKLD